MMADLNAWWFERSPRERVLIGVMVGLIAMLLLWFGLIRPIDRAVERAAARHDSAVRDAATVAGKVTALRLARGDAILSAGSDPVAFVRASGEAAGFTLARIDGGDAARVTLSIISAKSPALFAWLAALDRSGMFVERAVIRPNSDTTLSFEATLRARGR
jgi:general secretion pathway protein M